MSIKKEIGLDIDDFDQQKILSKKDSIAQIVLNVLFMKPGHLPNLPHIGIDINQYLYKRDGDFDPSELKSKIASQSSELLQYMIAGEISIKFNETPEGQVLIIGIPISIDNGDELLIVGLSTIDGNAISSLSSKTNIVYDFSKLI